MATRDHEILIEGEIVAQQSVSTLTDTAVFATLGAQHLALVETLGEVF